MKRRPPTKAAEAAAAAAAPTPPPSSAPPPPAPPPPPAKTASALRRALASLYTRLPAASRLFALRYEDVDLVIRALEPVAVLLCVTLIAAAVFYYSAAVTPEIFSRHGRLVGLAHTTFGLSLCYAFGYSYWHLLTTPPGTTKTIGKERLEALRKKAAAEGGGDADWLHCDRCALPKPPLAHHCSVCRACVLRADHHCPWFANCLGFGNYRHFVLFLVYLSVGAAYACATTYALHSSAAVHEPWAYRWLIVLALLSGGLALALGALLCWHLGCLWTGMGTLEMMDRLLGWHEEEEEDDDEEDERRRRRPKNAPPRRPLPAHVAVASLRDYPWNLGLEGNVRLAFDLQDDGKGWWWVLWLRVHGAPRKGDGVVFPTQQRRRQRQEEQQRRGGGEEEKKKKKKAS